MSRLDVRAMSLLSVAHVVDDYNQSFIPALLPFLIVERHLSHQLAATLILAQAISSSVVQPAIGNFADRRSMPWLIPIGFGLAGLGIAALGWLQAFPLLLLAALVSGIGVATFHPEAARFANYVSGAKKASGMRWFALGGNVGFALGPVFATAAVAAWGLRGTMAAFVPVLLVAALFVVELPRLRGFVPSAAKRRAALRSDDWRAFWKLSAIVVIRSMAYFGLVTFIPLYIIEVLRGAPALGNAALTVFLVAGIAGTITGGPLADRIGRKPVVLFSTAATACATFAFVALGPSIGIVAAMGSLVVVGFVLYISQAPMVVLGQEYLPNRIGLASGVTLGLAVSLGGMFTPVLGAIADHRGIAATLVTVASLAALAAVLSLALPHEMRRHATASKASAA
jgi:FSR family fosmidomycin resistance protein-like MFS transporter